MLINKNIFSSLRWRIAFAYLLVIGMGFLAINGAILDIVKENLIYTKRTTFQKYSIEIAQLLANDYYKKDPNIFYNIQEIGDEISQLEGESTRILILNNNGVVDHDSYKSASLLKRDLSSDFPEIASILNGSSMPAREANITTGDPPAEKRVMYAFAPITHYSVGIIGIVFVSTSLDSIDLTLQEIKETITFYSFIIIICIIIISFILAGLITRPINKLTTGITKMSKGHLNQRVEIRGGGEFKQLGDAFNTMSEKLENLDNVRNEFVSNASHELKTPLAAMKVLAESLIHMDVDDPAIYKEFLTDIDSEIDRLNAIVTDLLTLVNVDKNQESSLKLETVNLSELTKTSLKGLQILADQKQITLELDYEENITVTGDRMKLQQVISNIVDNGIKYTPEGGRVSVDVYKSPENAIIRVSDTGIGIPVDDLTKIYDRFYRVDKARSRETGGTGLGLSIANSIIMMHNGYIRANSEVGKGTTFYIEIPYTQAI